MVSARGPDSASAGELGIDVRAPLLRIARQTPRPLHPVSASRGGGEQPRCWPRVQSLLAYVWRSPPSSKREIGLKCYGALHAAMGHERRFPGTSGNGPRNGLANVCSRPQPDPSTRQVRTFRDLFLITELLDSKAESDDVGF